MSPDPNSSTPLPGQALRRPHRQGDHEEQAEAPAAGASLVPPAPVVASAAGTEDTPLTRIRPGGGLAPLGLRELWEYRELVYFLLWRQLKADYRQMALGPLWLVLRPALSVVIYTLIFSVLADLPSDDLPYPLFNFSAVIVWTFFTGAVQGAANSLLNSRDLLSKVYFPRLVVPIVSVCSGLITFSISFVMLLGLMAYYGHAPGWTIALAPVYLGVAALLALGIGVWFAPWIVHYRDVASVLDYVLLGWMYLSPVVYAMSAIPAQWHDLYRLNPMTNVLQGFRWAVLGVGDPPGLALALSAGLTLPLFVLGAYHFRRAERSIVDIA